MQPGRTAVVTGATGFLGPFAVRALRERFPDMELRCVVRASSDTSAIRLPGVTFVTGDLTDRQSLQAAFAGADVLIHLASMGFGWMDNVVEAARHARIPRGIFVSTTAIMTRLAVSSRSVRQSAEEAVRGSGLTWTILRPTMIYGTHADRNISRLIRIAAKSPVLPVLAPHALQQPVHVKDVAAAVAGALAEPATAGRAYNISGGAPLPMRELVASVTSALGRHRLRIPVPLTPLIWLLTLWSKVTKPPISVEQVQRINEDKSFDHADAARDFGYAPRTFPEGVRQQVAAMGLARDAR